MEVRKMKRLMAAVICALLLAGSFSSPVRAISLKEYTAQKKAQTAQEGETGQPEEQNQQETKDQQDQQGPDNQQVQPSPADAGTTDAPGKEAATQEAEFELFDFEISQTDVPASASSVQYSYSTASAVSEGYPALRETLASYCAVIRDAVSESARELYESGAEVDEYGTSPYVSEYITKVRADSRVVSFWDQENHYDGNEYQTASYGVSIDPVTGNYLSLEEVLQDHIDINRDLPQIIAMVLDEEYDYEAFDQEFADVDELTGYLTDIFTEEWDEPLRWTVGYEGITLILPKEFISSYDQEMWINVLYQDFADLVRPEYTEVPEEALDQIFSGDVTLETRKFYLNDGEEYYSPVRGECDLLICSYGFDIWDKTYELAYETAEQAREKLQELKAEQEPELAGSEMLYFSVTDYHRRADRSILSFVREWNEISTDFQYYRNRKVGYNFDTRTGKELTLDQVVTDRSAFGDLLRDALYRQFENLDPEEFEEGVDRLVQAIVDGEYGTGSDELSWAVGYESIMMLYDPALVLDFVDSGLSTSSLAIPYAGNEDVFAKRVLHTPDTWTMRITSAPYTRNTSAYDYIDIDGDGTLDEIYVEFGPGEQGGMKGSCTIWNGEMMTSDDLFTGENVGLVSVYIVKNNEGKYYMFLPCSFAEDYWTEVFQIDSEGLQQTGSSFAGACEFRPFDSESSFIFNNPNRFGIYGYIPLMGSHFGIKWFQLNQTYMYPEEGDLEDYDGLLYFESYNDQMKVARKLEGEIVVYDPEEKGATVEVLPGEVITLYRTDQESFVDFILPDSSCLRVYVTVTDMGEYMYEGELLENYFEDVSYAVG